MPVNSRKTIRLKEQLENRILHGLSCEWDNALAVLHNAPRAKMRKPLFSLRTMKNRLGYWAAERQEISLNREFVLSHPWSAVCDVLLHEMAHQLTDQVSRAQDRSPHGQAFKKACTLLRANPKAYQRFRPLDPSATTGIENGDDKILLRIKKLLALAESKNPFEAQSAMLKAHDLMAKYNIDLIKNNKEEREYGSMVIGTPALRHRRDKYQLAGLLHDFYFVKGIWISSYVLEKGKMGRVLEISGTSHNILNAAYVHDFVCHYIDSHWARYKKGKGLSYHRKTDFAGGIIEGFRSRICSQRKVIKRSGRKTYPVVIEDPQLLKYYKYKYPRTASISRKSIRSDKKTRDDGVCLGRKLVIYKGIMARKRSIGFLADK